MKTQNLLFLTSIVLSNAAISSELQEFGRGYIHLTEITNYTFEMKVTGQSKYAMSLESDKVTKQTTVKFSPKTDHQSAPYDNFEHEQVLPETIDETVSLTLKMDDFIEYNGSRWFKETDVKFKEKFSPKSTVLGAIDHITKVQNISGKDLVDSVKKRHLYLATKYTENKPYSNHQVDFDEENRTETVTNSENHSQDIKVNFQNHPVFVGDMSKNKIRTKYINGFYFSHSYSFVKELIKAASKQKDIAYTYYLYSLTRILPIEVSRDLDNYRSDYQVSIVDNKDGTRNLNCVKKSKDRYTCQLTYELTSRVVFPNSAEIKNHSYPAYVTETLSRSGMTNKQFQAESDAIDLGAIRDY